jgi:DinB superfamily
MAETTPPDALAARLRAASSALAAFGPAVEAGRPWPLHVVDHDAGPESEWGPTDVLAHVAEMLLYWRGEIARILDGGPGPVPFGRLATDRVRVLTIERDRTLPPGELLERIEAATGRYARLIAGLDADGLARRGVHPARGELTVGEILERFVVGHAEEHVVQLGAALSPTHPGESAPGT